jgi:hypothetical protein
MSSHQIGLSGIESQEQVMMGMDPKKNEEISEILNNSIPQRHSFFQLRYFVIGKEPTNQAKMWQCLRELESRKDSIESLSLEYEEQKDVLELLDIEENMLKLTKLDGQNEEIKLLKEKELKIKIKKIKRQKKAIKSNIIQLLSKKKYIEEEIDFFLEMFKAIEKVEKLRPLDDVEAQKNYWSEKLTQKLNLKMLSGGQIESDLIETIVALPDDMNIKKQMIKTLAFRQEQIVKKLEENRGKINGN